VPIAQPDLGEDDSSQDDTSEDDPSQDDIRMTPTKVEYFAGWDHEQQKAWRAPTQHPQRREFALSYSKKDGAKPTDPIQAHFHDGGILEVSDMTCEEFQDKQEGVVSAEPAVHMPKKKKAGAHAIAHWQEKHVKTGFQVRVADRTNKGDVIVTLYYGGGGATKQICQLKPAAMGGDGDSQPMAVEIMIEVAKQFALNKFGDNTKV
jgi:hypothetical protein